MFAMFVVIVVYFFLSHLLERLVALGGIVEHVRLLHPRLLDLVRPAGVGHPVRGRVVVQPSRERRRPWRARQAG